MSINELKQIRKAVRNQTSYAAIGSAYTRLNAIKKLIPKNPRTREEMFGTTVKKK